MSGHAFLSASSAHRWTRCPVAPWREKDMPDVSSVYAEEGTLAHALLEQALTGELVEPSVFPEDMHREVAKVLQVIRSIEADTVLPEQRLDISSITSEPSSYRKDYTPIH